LASFWSDLKQILGLLTQSRIAALTFAHSGHYVADRLAPLIAQVRFSLANAVAQYGQQSGNNEPR
jgi:hypothetical protein